MTVLIWQFSGLLLVERRFAGRLDRPWADSGCSLQNLKGQAGVAGPDGPLTPPCCKRSPTVATRSLQMAGIPEPGEGLGKTNLERAWLEAKRRARL